MVLDPVEPVPPADPGRAPRLACADFSFAGVGHSATLDIVADLGFAGVSLGFFSDLTELTPELIRGKGRYWGEMLAGHIRSRGLLVADVFGSGHTAESMALNHPDATEREPAADLFHDLADIAVAVGAEGMTLLPGIQHEGQSWTESVQLSADELSWRLDEAQRRGLALSVEPHRGAHVDSPEKVAQLLDLVPGLQLTLDYGHFHVQGIPDQDVDPLLDHTRHFHCRGGAIGVIQTSFEENTIDFGRILEAMNDRGYAGWIEIEYIRWAEAMGGRDCDNLREVARYRDFFRLQA